MNGFRRSVLVSELVSAKWLSEVKGCYASENYKSSSEALLFFLFFFILSFFFIASLFKLFADMKHSVQDCTTQWSV